MATLPDFEHKWVCYGSKKCVEAGGFDSPVCERDPGHRTQLVAYFDARLLQRRRREMGGDVIELRR